MAKMADVHDALVYLRDDLLPQIGTWSGPGNEAVSRAANEATEALQQAAGSSENHPTFRRLVQTALSRLTTLHEHPAIPRDDVEEFLKRLALEPRPQQ